MNNRFIWSLKNRYVIWNLYLSYIILLLIPLIMGIIIYSYNLNIIQKETIRYNTLVLKNTMNILDMSMDDVESIVYNILKDRSIEAMMAPQVKNNASLAYDVSKLIKKLPPIFNGSKLIEDYYIYSKFNDYMFTYGKGFLNVKKYYDCYFKHGNLSYEDWYSTVLDTFRYKEVLPVDQIMVESKSKSRITYLHSYQFHGTGEVAGQIICYINEELIQQMMQSTQDIGANIMYIIDKNGKIITSYGQDKMNVSINDIINSDSSGNRQILINGQKVIISYMVSSKYGWTYVIGVPKQVLIKKAGNVLQTIILYIGILLGIGIAIAVVLANYNGKPLINIMRKLLLTGKNKHRAYNVFKDIEEAIYNLLNEKETLKCELESQNNILMKDRLIQLINGDYFNKYGIETLFSYTDVKNSNNEYRGVFIAVNMMYDDDMTSSSMQSMLITNILKQHSDCFPIYAPIYENCVALICVDSKNICEEIGENIISIFTSIYKLLKYKYGIEIAFYIGNACGELSKVHKSFSSAKKMLNLKENNGEKFIILAQDAIENIDKYVYTVADEQKLINLVSVGNYEDIDKIIDNIYRINFQEKNLSAFMVKLLLYHMMGTLTELNNKNLLQEEFENINIELPVDKFFQVIKNHYKQICDEVIAKKKSYNVRIRKEIIEYINENYSNCNLSLRNVAYKFGMTESYMSIFIKEQLGETFINYIERLRINKANEFLDRKSSSIDDIAQRLGYTSAHSFRRAYKRVVGYSPSRRGDIICNNVEDDMVKIERSGIL